MRLARRSVNLATRTTFCSWVSGVRSARRRWARLRSLRILRNARSFLESLPAANSFATFSLRSAIFFLSASFRSAIGRVIYGSEGLKSSKIRDGARITKESFAGSPMGTYNPTLMASLPQLATMGWGKVRRAFLIAFRKKRVEEKLDRRRGACSRCGACCKIMFRCPAYDDSDGNPKCLIYNDRPGVCSLFPLDEKDLRERDIVMPGTKCG